MRLKCSAGYNTFSFMCVGLCRMNLSAHFLHCLNINITSMKKIQSKVAICLHFLHSTLLLIVLPGKCVVVCLFRCHQKLCFGIFVCVAEVYASIYKNYWGVNDEYSDLFHHYVIFISKHEIIKIS